MVEVRNAVITSASFTTEYGLSAWVQLDYGGSSQGFGGYLLYAPQGSLASSEPVNYCGHFIWRVLAIAGVNDWSQLPGRTVRVKSDRMSIVAIGHIINDDWFDPKAEFEQLAAAAQLGGVRE